MTLGLDRDVVIALSYAPSGARLRLTTLWRLDGAISAAMRGRDPMIGRIKLAWWRDALEALDVGPAPHEPTLQAVSEHLIPAGVSGAWLAVLASGWDRLIDPDLTDDLLARYAAERGGTLFAAAKKLLAASMPVDVMAAGEAWALVDLARHSRGESEADRALAFARARLGTAERWPAKLRPLAMLRLLAIRDSHAQPGSLELSGAPARMLRLLRYRLAGR